MARLRSNVWIGYGAAVLGPAAVTGLFTSIPDINITTVALGFLLTVLMVASAWGLGPGILASLAGVSCLNYFFLPPIGSFTVQDPQNWVALVAFLITAFVASQLSSAARSRARDAENRQEEVIKLYQFSRAIMEIPDSDDAVSSIARRVIEIFEASACGFYAHSDDGHWSRLVEAGSGGGASIGVAESDLDRILATGEPELVSPSAATLPAGAPGQVIVRAPLKVGVRVNGVMVLISAALGLQTVEAIASLVALALERARFLREASRAQALKESDELKSALLASVSHSLRTPLTSIRAAVDSLLHRDVTWDQTAAAEFHLIIREEVDRLTRLITNLLEMARIEGGELRPAKGWGSISEILSNVLERCSSVLGAHRVTVQAADLLPLIKVDSRQIAEALANLLENAARYSPAETEITLEARVESGVLQVSVADRGPGIPAAESSKVFDKFYRGGSGRHVDVGTGMGLAITKGIVEAHGGRVWVKSQPGSGSIFGFDIPVEAREPEASLRSDGVDAESARLN